MPIREIPKTDWMQVCKNLSQQHEGAPVTVEVLGADAGTRELARDVPLEGITAERKRGAYVVEVFLGEAEDRHLSHVVSRPVHMRIRESETGEHEALQIESENRATTTILFGPPGSKQEPQA